jgi:hypothetical protein
MLRYGVLFALTISISSAISFGKKSELNIRFIESGNYLVVINDTKYTAKNVFQICDVEPGTISIQIIKQVFNPYMDDVTRTLIYDGELEIKPNTKLTATVHKNNSLIINNIVPLHEDNDVHGNNIDIEFQKKSMSLSQFKELKKIVRSTTLSAGKLNVMKQSIAIYGISSFQVKELMSMLHLERDRKALVSYAKDFAHDKNNYFIVKSGFKFI